MTNKGAIFYEELSFSGFKIFKLALDFIYDFHDILYNIYYKTNQKDEYMVLKKNLNGGEDNFISLTDLHLEKDEKITILASLNFI